MIQKLISEKTAFYNKQYKDEADGQDLINIQRDFINALARTNRNKKLPHHAFYADDCFVLYRNLGFLYNESFAEALTYCGADDALYARIWRVWVLAWSVRLKWSGKGAILDCGTYNGKALQVALHYARLSGQSRKGPIIACDLFESPPNESRKVDHGPSLHKQTYMRLAEYGNVHVIKGKLPNIFSKFNLPQIDWCQIDLNSASADGDTFRAIFDKLCDGAVVILDDYGFSRYKETQAKLDSICEALQVSILELPTGQGLYIHTKQYKF